MAISAARVVTAATLAQACGRGSERSRQCSASLNRDTTFSQHVRLTWQHGRERGRKSLHIRNVGWDPEGILAPPVPGHISRRKSQRSLAEDEKAKEAQERAAQKERERRATVREARVVPTTDMGVIDFFLDTEMQEMEYEIARFRPRLNDEFFDALRNEMGNIRFAANASGEEKEKLAELEALEKVLKEGIEGYDEMAKNMMGAKDRLQQILQSKDKKATLLEMASGSQIDRSLLALLDQNISAANAAEETQVVEFMQKIRGAVIKYITL